MSDERGRGSYDGFEPVPRLTVQLDGKIELAQVQEIIAQLYKNSGCAPCGRLSFTMEALDDDYVLPSMRPMRDIAGIKSITVR